MAKKSLLSFLILASMIAPLSLPVPLWIDSANAAERPRPKSEKCLSLARKIGASRVWWGRHVGQREAREKDDFFKWGSRKESFNAIGCFKTRAECEDWLYWKRTDYPEFGQIRPCRRGL